MAGTQKKQTGTRKRSSGSRKRSAVKKRPLRREIAGGVCWLIALCILVSYTSETAPVVSALRAFFSGILGYGYYVVPLALLYAGAHLIWHHGRPVRLRTAGILLAPVFLSGFLHLLLCRQSYAWSGILQALYRDGQAAASGGILGGFLAHCLLAAMGTVLSGVILLALTVAAVCVGMKLDPRIPLEKLRQREWVPYEPEPEKPAKVHIVPAAKTRQAIDIPLDGEQTAAVPMQEKKHLPFFRRRSAAIRTPDEVLRQHGEEEAFSKKSEGASPEPLPPVVTPAPTVPEELKAREHFPAPAPAPKEKAAENEQLTVEEAKEISQELENGLNSISHSYQYPPLTMLNRNFDRRAAEADSELRENSRRLAETLHSFGVVAKPGDVVRGPSVTRYEYVLDQGVKLSKITNLADDIALALGAGGVRIAPIPDKISVVGIEVPNKVVQPVYIREVVESRTFQEHKSSVAFAVGRDIGGNNVVGDIARLPHVLIAGTTGSGKSVCTNSLIISLLYKSSPQQVRFIMVDPKMVELAPYNGIPHLLIPVVTDPKKAAGALQWAVYEMMKRYKTFSEHGVKKLEEYNELAQRTEGMEPIPAVVVVIDELADLMLVAAKEVEESICRVAQMGRAAGMHLVIATQRPSADVITGLMKANIPSRIAFAVASALESRIILDNSGAEKLVGKGDMLYAPLGAGKPQRVQGCFITPEEIEKVVNFVKQSAEPQYSDEVMHKIEEFGQEKPKGGAALPAETAASDSAMDELLPAAVEVVLETGQASVSMLQRRLKLGYSRAARIVDEMEERGIVGPFEGSKPRQLLITKAQWQEMQTNGQQMEIAEMPTAEEEM